MIYLEKNSDDLVSHCSCAGALVTFPAQMDCPWCGCGWLFTCMNCRKAFTFARGVVLDTTWEELAVSDIRAGWGEEPDKDSVAEWVSAMQAILAGVVPGQTYVVLDGSVLPANAESVNLDGWYARHELNYLPHTRALQDRAAIDSVLANVEYWRDRRHPDA